jgi:phage pi2 protein 07
MSRVGLGFAFLDVCHAVLWLTHFWLLTAALMIGVLGVLFFLPETWTLSLGASWRWCIVGIAAVFSALMILRAFRHETGRRWRKIWSDRLRDRRHAWSFQRRGVVLGGAEDLGPYYAQEARKWRRALGLSARGFWVDGKMFALLGVPLVIFSFSPAPAASVVCLFLGSLSTQNIRVTVSEAMLEYPSYTQVPAFQWSHPSLPIRERFIRGSSFKVRLQPSREPGEGTQVRVAMNRLPILTEWDAKEKIYASQFQVMSTGKVDVQHSVFRRFWETALTAAVLTERLDAIPAVRIELIEQHTKVVEGERVKLKVIAHDDFGLRKLTLRVQQGGRSSQELIKYFSETVSDHEELFVWDSSGAALEKGAFKLMVMARDAAPSVEGDLAEEARAGYSNEIALEFLSAEERFQDQQQVLAQWLKETEAALEVVESPDKMKTYLGNGDRLADALGLESPQFFSLFQEWGGVHQQLEDQEGEESAKRQQIEAFRDQLKALMEKREDQRMDERQAAVWDAFDAFKRSQLQETSQEERSVLRKQFARKFSQWEQGFDHLNDAELKQWDERQKIPPTLKSVQEAGEKASRETLEKMEKELSEGMSAFEQALSKRDQERMAQFRKTVDTILETLEAYIERETQLRDATQRTRDSQKNVWENLRGSQAQLSEDVQTTLDAFASELRSEPAMQMLIRGQLSQARQFMGMAEKSLGDQQKAASVLFEQKVIESLSQSSQSLSFLMQQMQRRAQFSRGRFDRADNSFKHLNGPFEGPKEYRDVLRKNAVDDRSTHMKQEEKHELYQRLMK